MNRVIPGALFISEEVREAILKSAINGERYIGEPEDLGNYDGAWDDVAKGFRRQDPSGSELPALFYSAKHAGK